MSDLVTDLAPIQSPLLAKLPGVRHAFFSRRGGVSHGIYESLNVGFGSGDEESAVRENRTRAAGWFGAGFDDLATVYQIHSAITHLTSAKYAKPPQGDAMVTRTEGLVLGVLSADCAPVLIADVQAGIVAAAHAGWRGALGGVVGSAVDAMIAQGADPARMVAAVGPCIDAASYEVGQEFLDAFTAEDAAFERFFASGAAPDKRQFDLPAFVLHRLAQAGVAQAEWVGADTCAEADLFFSNRRAFKQGEPDYGRLLSAIMIEG
jgi:YfiH family protein